LDYLQKLLKSLFVTGRGGYISVGYPLLLMVPITLAVLASGLLFFT